MSNEQLDKLTKICEVCSVRHLDYKREEHVHIWHDGQYHPVQYPGRTQYYADKARVYEQTHKP